MKYLNTIKCRICGCTEDNPCFNPVYGFCWWTSADRTLCSHCADPLIRDAAETVHRVNDISGWKPEVMLNE